MKENILIIGFPVYAALDFYKNKLEKHGFNYNFYIITGHGISKEFYDELSLLRKKKKICNFYIIPTFEKKFIKTFSVINSFFLSRKILFDLKNINFSKIFCSDFLKPELKFIINRLYYTSTLKIFSISISNFNLYNNIKYNFYSYDNFKTIIKELFQIRSMILKIFKYIEGFFFNILSLFILQEITHLGSKKHFLLFFKKHYALISSKDFEIDAYLKKFENLNVYYLSEDRDCKCVENYQYKKKLLVVLENTINKKLYTDYIIEEFYENILLLNKKYKFSCIDIKSHPSDFSLTSKILENKILKKNINVKVFKKNFFLNGNYCDYSVILGGVSSVMLSSVNQCKNIVAIGISNVANLTCINPTPKNVTGDIKNFKSGIIWIEDTDDFINLSFADLFSLSKVLRTKRFTQNFKFKDFEKLLEL